MIHIKRISILFLLSLIIISGIGLIFLLNYMLFPISSIQNLDIELNFNESNAFLFIKNQTQDIGYRIPGSEEIEECREFFISEFTQIDSEIDYYFHNFSVSGINCSNILFKMNTNYKNIFILASHYDSRAKATKDSVNPEDPVPGANDGASGCAVLLELIRALYPRKDNLSCEVWFLFFDAEDQGRDVDYGIEGWNWCEGSYKFVNDINKYYNSTLEYFEGLILLDMVGGNNLRFINELHSTSSLLDELFSIGKELGYSSAFPNNPESNSIIDDHKPFIEKGIPAADLIINFWNNPDWPFHHTTNDNLSNISMESLKITGETIEQFLYNNFYNISGNNYKGNYPWGLDTDLIKIDIFAQIGIYLAIVCVFGVIYAIYKNNIKK